MLEYSLEVAHVDWGSSGALESVAESMAVAAEITEKWKRQGSTYTCGMLIDDKEFRIGDRESWLRSLLAEFHPQLKVVKFACFESDLVGLKDEFLSQIDDEHSGRVSREIERYRRKHGRVACSQDIAIWHLLRLGLLPSGASLLYPLSDISETNFYAKQVLSILEEGDKAAEERAREIIKHCRKSDVVNRIKIEYYA